MKFIFYFYNYTAKKIYRHFFLCKLFTNFTLTSLNFKNNISLKLGKVNRFLFTIYHLINLKPMAKIFCFISQSFHIALLFVQIKGLFYFFYLKY